MANSQFDNFSFNPEDLYLNPAETDLLLAALDSNKPIQNASNGGNANTGSMLGFAPQSSSGYLPQSRDATQATSNKQSSTNVATRNEEAQSNPYLEFDTSTEGVWDWNLNRLPEHFSGDPYARTAVRQDSNETDEGADDDQQESSGSQDGDSGDKRKNSDDPDEDDGGGKRQETDPKTGKKQSQRPGRKPLTSEPTTKRKAQNRAAQRAFRERKEKHLKDLETKVEELEKASAATNHENGRLKAQVDKLQTELKEYRKQLSVNTGPRGGSPTFGGIGQPYSSRANWDINNNFNFEFPKFGPPTDNKYRSLSGNTVSALDNQSVVASPASLASSRGHSSSAADLSSLFPPDGLSNVDARSQSTGLTSPVSQSQGGNKSGNRPTATTLSRHSVDSNIASPASSGSNVGFTSSCATTPEASCETPDQRKDTGPNAGGTRKSSRIETQDAFSLTPALTTHSQDSNLDFSGLDWLANQNGGAFDPILFGDYREPQDNIMSGFFNDAFPALNDFGSPTQTTQTQPLEPRLPKKKDLMQQIEEQQAGKEPEVVPGEERQQFLTCNLLWDRVQRSHKVQSGEADMDDLCTQLKSKAKCSGSGAVISQSDVDAILGPAARENAEPDFLKMFK